jgi:hypothetical protein
MCVLCFCNRVNSEKSQTGFPTNITGFSSYFVLQRGLKNLLKSVVIEMIGF